MDNQKQLQKVRDMLVDARVEAIGLEDTTLKYQLSFICIQFIDGYNDKYENNSK
tara:strand:+ start:401 stop:562 length:162 start_codon:yes stop_codon:yes gene_type:complete